ncbi:MAG: hypothetical protein AAFR14_09090 [Bacteroidota bacterium]
MNSNPTLRLRQQNGSKAIAGLLSTIRTKDIFLIDAIGAFASAMLFLVVLPMVIDHIGMSVIHLRFLGFWPIAFVVIDKWGYTRSPSQQLYWLRVISILNVGYCLLSVAFLVVNRAELTGLGWLYFVG